MVHKYINFIKEDINPVDPYGEEKWEEGDDEITKKIKSALLKFIDEMGGGRYKERIVNEFFGSLTKEQGNDETYYQIRGDFGDHILDPGKLMGVVRARSRDEARAIFTLTTKRKDYIDILLTGFYSSRRITRDEIDKTLEESRKELRRIQRKVDYLENPRGHNDI